MAVLVLDRYFEERIRAERGDNDRDEVWDGVLVMSPIANNEHQDIAGELAHIVRTVLGSREAGRIFQGCNVSDRVEGWMQNYRIPDIAVYLAGNPAKDCETHWSGGPDLAIEIVSDQDRSRDKGAFYANVGVREFLVIDRDPWAVELYRPAAGSMELVASATPGSVESIRLGVLPLSIRLMPGETRPSIEVAHETDGRRWSV
jgi:Uma2 family endonuclease